VTVGRLDELDMSADLPKKEAKQRLKAAQERMQELRLSLAGLDGDHRLGPPLCVVLEGWDASGKGGAIKRMVAKLDPRHVRVKQYSSPTPDELRHHWLWRFWPALPGWGGMAILDRSWYGRVLVERVEGYASRRNGAARTGRSTTSSARSPTPARCSSSCGCISPTRSSSRASSRAATTR
jgi:polyphosphate kinase 2 (PPK2 family)